MTSKQSVGSERLRVYRESMGYSQEKLGEFLNVSREYISMLENGERRPGRELSYNIEKLANIPMRSWR